MSGLNFDNIEVPAEKEQTSVSKFKRVEKGAQVLTITKVEDVTAGTGTPGFEITFHSDKADADFTHKFWATGKAAPRLQSLMIGFTGAKATGTMTTEQLAAVLVGQSSNCIVDADIRVNEKDGKTYNNEYATLRYADFANKSVEFKDEDARVNPARNVSSVTTTSVLDTVEGNSDDLPF